MKVRVLLPIAKLFGDEPFGFFLAESFKKSNSIPMATNPTQKWWRYRQQWYLPLLFVIYLRFASKSALTFFASPLFLVNALFARSTTSVFLFLFAGAVALLGLGVCTITNTLTFAQAFSAMAAGAQSLQGNANTQLGTLPWATATPL
jgi:hypothetical protein